MFCIRCVAPPGRCLFNRGNRDGSVPGYNPPRYPAPRLRDHATHEESSLEHESVYKFMIMTSLLHISVTYRGSSFLPMPPPPLFPVYVRAFPIRQRFMLSAVYLSPHCMSCAPNGTTTRFCIYIQPFVIVCKAAAHTCRATALPNRRDRFGSGGPARHSATRKTVASARKESGRCVRTFVFSLSFFFFV